MTTHKNLLNVSFAFSSSVFGSKDLSSDFAVFLSPMVAFSSLWSSFSPPGSSIAAFEQRGESCRIKGEFAGHEGFQSDFRDLFFPRFFHFLIKERKKEKNGGQAAPRGWGTG